LDSRIVSRENFSQRSGYGNGTGRKGIVRKALDDTYTAEWHRGLGKTEEKRY
jgi:hypothetical protein